MKEVSELLKGNSQEPAVINTVMKSSDLHDRLMAYAERDVVRYNAREGTLNNDDGIDCPVCKNKGFIAVNQDGYMCLKKCPECSDRRDGARAIKNSSLEALTKKRLRDYKVTEEWQKNIRDLAINYMQSDELPKSWFVMLGYSGTGKTHVCAAIANAMMDKYRVYVRYIIWSETIRKIKAEIADVGYSQTLTDLCKYRVLYIDDLFKGKVTEADDSYAFQIINSRYNNDLTTIISSERFLDRESEIESKRGLVQLNEAIAGRIKEKSGRFFIQIAQESGRNYRMKKGDSNDT